MAMSDFKYPNWCQKLIAEKIGLNPEGVAVRLDNDTQICFLEHETRLEHLVSKETGNVIIS